tara:strand:+ start:1527 stop:1781 length:255 start_codon:yes stop_codon:yes gene_type:complete
MSKVIKLMGSEFTAPTDLANANSAVDSTLVKVYHTAAVTVTVVTSANAAVGNTTLDAGVHYIQKAPSDKIFASAGKFTPVAFTH